MNLYELCAVVSLDKSDYEKGVAEVAKSGSTLSDKLKTGFDKVKKGAAVVTGAISAIGVGLLALEQSTEETRISQGKLATAFEAAGLSADAAKSTFNAFYGILGDTDTATEASQLLAKLTENEEDLATWTDIAAGVCGTFGDSLPIEGLIEASNETSKVGQVVGVLADALNWAGISEDDFNEKLAACSSESERNKLIMDTLSRTYDEASDAFYKNNETLVQSRENQAALNESLAKVGEAVSKVKNAFLEQFAPAIDQVATKAAEFVSNLDPEAVVDKIKGLIDTFETLLPVITGVTAATLAYKAAVAISSIIEGVTKATQGLSVAQAALNAVMNANPFVLVATLIAGLVTAIVTLWNTNEGFRDAVKKIWEQITGFFKDAWEGIKKTFEGWGDFFGGLWDDLTNIFSNVKEWFSNVGKNIVNGIKSGIQNAWEGLKSWFSNAWDSLFGGRSATATVTGGAVNGSHASGLWNVPYDGYIAELHRGEMVVPARQASQMRDRNSTAENINIVVQSVLDGKVIGETAYRYSRQKARAYGF